MKLVLIPVWVDPGVNPTNLADYRIWSAVNSGVSVPLWLMETITDLIRGSIEEAV